LAIPAVAGLLVYTVLETVWYALRCTPTSHSQVTITITLVFKKTTVYPPPVTTNTGSSAGGLLFSGASRVTVCENRASDRMGPSLKM